MDGVLTLLRRTVSIVHRRSIVRPVSPSFARNMSASRNGVATMEERDSTFLYKDAIEKLNSLQSNAATRAAAANRRDDQSLRSLIPEMWGRLEAVGLTRKHIESLNTIHVTGTKGKGTTCAFTESILRQAGLKTGLYTSPHLVAVRERIRINGVPLSQHKFAQYFHPVFQKLKERADQDPSFGMPPYFRFLTCMAFHAFIEEGVDVAIFEVGIGGRYDCTNVIPNPVSVGITALGLEHQSILGNSLEEIAWNKGGILKKGCDAFTVYSHPKHLQEVLDGCAREAECKLSVVPRVSQMTGNKNEVKLGVDDGDVSEMNASLAVQLATSFLKKRFSEKLKNDMLPVPAFVAKGLEETRWPGRFQVLRKSSALTYFIDGAHTAESLNVALSWFKRRTLSNSFRVLIFSTTGQRDPKLLIPLAEANAFHFTIFCPVERRGTNASDNWNALSLGVDLMGPCREKLELWNQKAGNGVSGVCLENTDAAVEFVEKLSSNAERNQNLEHKVVEVLVTGSLHLVGTVLSILDPEMTDQ